MYKSKYTKDVIVFVGMGHGDYMFRYASIFSFDSGIYFSLTKVELDKYWEKL